MTESSGRWVARAVLRLVLGVLPAGLLVAILPLAVDGERTADWEGALAAAAFGWVLLVVPVAVAATVYLWVRAALGRWLGGLPLLPVSVLAAVHWIAGPAEAYRLGPFLWVMVAGAGALEVLAGPPPPWRGRGRRLRGSPGEAHLGQVTVQWISEPRTEST